MTNAEMNTEVVSEETTEIEKAPRKPSVEDRIQRWVDTGKATKILLMPEDYVKVQKKKEAIEEQYKLPMTILGGKAAMNTFLRLSEEIEKDEREAILANLTDVFQSEE